VVVSEGELLAPFHVVVVCFFTTPGSGSVTVFFCSTAPLSQVVEVCVPGAGVIVVVWVVGVVVTTGGVTWTTGGGVVCTSFVVLEMQPATVNAAIAAMAGDKIR